MRIVPAAPEPILLLLLSLVIPAKAGIQCLLLCS
jgi:hypothetical protein